MERPPARLMELLERGAEELGDPIPDPARERLARLAGLLARWARRVNLTAHTSPEAVVRRLVLDALALGRALPPLATMADLGSGAGFPGLPLAIRHPERRLTLVEARARRHHFQRAAVRELGLENVTLLQGRVETLEALPHAAAVAQAVAPPPVVLAWMLPWVRPGGLLVIPGGAEPPRPGEHPEVEDAGPRAYRVPLGGPHRTLWVGRRRSP